MTDWGTVFENAAPRQSVDIATLKRQLPLEWVVLHSGIVLEPDGAGRMIGFCPFHEDTGASFAVFQLDGDEIPMSRCGCWSCDFHTGDVFDFLGRLHQVPTPQAVQLGGRLLSEFMQDTSWTQREVVNVVWPKANPDGLIAIARQAEIFARQDPTAILRLIDERANNRQEPGWQGITAQFLIDFWKVGVEDDWEIVVPHLSWDDLGAAVCLGLKTRTARSPLIARGGSDLSRLYGEFQLQGHQRVLVTEGESDAWCASYALQGHGVDVLSLPAGAGGQVKERWLDLLTGKDVTLAFDGDRAGRVAGFRWWNALYRRQGLGPKDGPAKVNVASLPDGKDLSSVSDLVTLVMSAGPVPPPGGNINRDPIRNVYTRTVPGKSEEAEDTVTVIANWGMEPLRELDLDDHGTKGWEGMVNGKDVLLRSSDLESQSAITRWAASVGGNWTGMAKDAQNLQGQLQTQGPFLARGRACSVLGWHDRNFVLPEGYIGPDYWRYLPPPASIAEAMVNLRIQPGNWNPLALQLMRAMNRSNVTDPILAWLFAAPLRSHFPVFPFLAVTGVSGNGKTAMMEAMLDAFGWKIMTTLTNSTPHAVQSFAGATNGIPVWFDEYRAAAREDSKTQLDQVLRDAYNGSPSFKGGGSGENRLSMTAMPTGAPIIVTGEDAFQETSHFERMVLVKLDKRDRSPEAYKALKQVETTGMGHAYLQWLVDTFNNDQLPSLAVRQENGRVDVNKQILNIGWELLRAFYGAATGEEFGAPDFSKYEADLTIELATDPFTSAMVWALYEPPGYGQGPVVWFDGADVLVRTEELVSSVKRKGVFVLPGGIRAYENYLEVDWNGRVDLHPSYGRVFRLSGMALRLHNVTAPDPAE